MKYRTHRFWVKKTVCPIYVVQETLPFMTYYLQIISHKNPNNAKLFIVIYCFWTYFKIRHEIKTSVQSGNNSHRKTHSKHIWRGMGII